MMNPSPLQAVEHFYDFHPISAEQIFQAVAARQITREDITQAVLSAHDQDHYGGTEAVDHLMGLAAITADAHLLEEEDTTLLRRPGATARPKARQGNTATMASTTQNTDCESQRDRLSV